MPVLGKECQGRLLAGGQPVIMIGGLHDHAAGLFDLYRRNPHLDINGDWQLFLTHSKETLPANFASV